MTPDEHNFEEFVKTIRFDDQPSSEHRQRLEFQLLQRWENRQKETGYIEPAALYLKRLAIAAGILLASSVLFWTIDNLWISRPLAVHPDSKMIETILQQEQPSEAEKPHLLAQINHVWHLICRQDSEALVSILQTQETAYAIRCWAAKYLGQFGNEKTLELLNTAIETLHISDSNEPLVLAARTIRQRLEASEPNTPN
ncbi:MAG TPA: hypothetical protein PK052_08520 [Anaerohalosphaeraceae bacterium]|nr:hypothetical protein [Phycisphaerae bacterium]HOK96233.1 hypothetical protein [Anaerohalosphaeraceae bacterium]HOL32012.1 hypothetical protein [Anaerohalosphaeraceae bacterium]HOM74884.1 hypothetical protein [Anaerohalosphaeraceae bacterium]HPC63847.1 hypothetical protein [Anaerohalosphaeraceae bacterium]